MPDKIVIDLDDIHEESPEENSGREKNIVEISEEELAEAAPKIEIDTIEESQESAIRKSALDFYSKGNQGLSGFYDSRLRFPEGIDRSFGLKFRIDLGQEFLSTLLVNNKYIVASSRNGDLYFVDRFDGVSCEKLPFENETFEKTGLIASNVSFINSPRNIYRIHEEERPVSNLLYATAEGSFIWSNLNRKNNLLLFTENSPDDNECRIVAINMNDGKVAASQELHGFSGDQICVTNYGAFSLYKNRLAYMNTDTLACSVHEINIECGETPFIMHMNNRLFVTTVANEVYYLDLPASGYNFRRTGIKNFFINSMAGFGDNIFIGTQEGWKYYKSSGLEIFSFDDEYENRIESVSKSVLVVSQKNRIIFSNLNRFQEAESFVISGADESENTEIISSVISFNDIYVLTSNGILSAFTNNRMNIHI